MWAFGVMQGELRHPTQPDVETALAAGFDGYMSKPIVPETFVSEVETYLPPSLRRTTAAGG